MSTLANITSLNLSLQTGGAALAVKSANAAEAAEVTTTQIAASLQATVTAAEAATTAANDAADAANLVSSRTTVLENVVFEDINIPEGREAAAPSYTLNIDANYYSEFDNWFDQKTRIIRTIGCQSEANGTAVIALFTLSGSVATLVQEKTVNIVTGANLFNAEDAIDNIGNLVLGTQYFVFIKRVTANTITYATGNTGKGRSILTATPTVLATNNFAVALWLDIDESNVFTPDEKNYVFGAPVDSFDLATELLTRDYVFVPPGTWNVSSKITLTSGKKIFGIRGKSILQFDTTSLTRCIDIVSVEDVELNGITIKGDSPNTVMSGNDVAAGVVDSLSDALGLVNVGTKIGVYISASKGVVIDNCEISNFDGYGIQARAWGASYYKTSTITNNFIHDCYCGMSLQEAFEYVRLSDNLINKCQIGVLCDAGNNMFSNNIFSGNRVGFILDNGTNNAHGTLSGCSFNHCSLYGLIAFEVRWGEIISACQFWYGDIYLQNCRGINIVGAQLSNMTLTVDGQFTGGGVQMLTDSMIMSTVTVTQLNTPDLKMKNNWKADGTSSTAYNN
jgi:parallel beta-helix repeat protein